MRHGSRADMPSEKRSDVDKHLSQTILKTAPRHKHSIPTLSPTKTKGKGKGKGKPAANATQSPTKPNELLVKNIHLAIASCRRAYDRAPKHRGRFNSLVIVDDAGDALLKGNLQASSNIMA